MFVALLLVAVIVPPLISARRFRSTIDSSISRALGRQVSVADVRLRLLPQPGFDLERFILFDDASFSAEPMLRADEVTAYLRLSSLWRGRLEVAKLSLKEPSFNLVRRGDGQWNIYALLERAAQIPSAPTSKHKPEARPRFPYIEADDGRINFKIGQEKKVYALTEADFALWQEEEDTWKMRVRARPVRTDANLSDTGTLRLTGTVQRAARLRNTPLRLELNLERAQLGQLSELIFGRDRGWRGTVSASAELSGTPAQAVVQATTVVQEFRRYDIIAPGSLRLAAKCSAVLSSVDHSWSNISCQAPVGEGVLIASGEGKVSSDASTYALRFVARRVPLKAIVNAGRYSKRDLPEDLAADGDLVGTFEVAKSEKTGFRPMWSGKGHTEGFTLSSTVIDDQLRLGDIGFSISENPGLDAQSVQPARRHGRKNGAKLPETQVAFGPFPLDLGGATPATVTARLSRDDYRVTVQGDSRLQRLAQIAKAVGLHAPPIAGPGSARVDLQITGIWAGFRAPSITGEAKLRNVFRKLNGITTPLQISSTDAMLLPEAIELRNLAATFPGTDIQVSGSATLVRHCELQAGCPARMDLRAGHVWTAALSQLLNVQPKKRPWYRLLEREQAGQRLAGMNAFGAIRINSLATGSMTAKHVVASFRIHDSKIWLKDVSAETFGGRHVGDWEIDFAGSKPVFRGAGSVERISMSQLATAMGDDWASGTVGLHYRAKTLGWTGAELASNLVADADFDLRDGALPHISLAAGSDPLRIRRFSGQLALQNGEFSINTGILQTPGSIYKVSGTALIDKKLNVTLVRNGSHAFEITGTLAAPKVMVILRPQTQAALTP